MLAFRRLISRFTSLSPPPKLTRHPYYNVVTVVLFVFVQEVYVVSSRAKRLLLHFLVELLRYALLLVVYFLAALRYLGNPMSQLFYSNLWVYAFATLFLIVVQSVFLEWVTSFLVKRLGLDKVE